MVVLSFGYFRGILTKISPVPGEIRTSTLIASGDVRTYNIFEKYVIFSYLVSH